MIVGDLAGAVWKERHVPHDQEWVDAILVPIPKKRKFALL